MFTSQNNANIFLRICLANNTTQEGIVVRRPYLCLALSMHYVICPPNHPMRIKGLILTTLHRWDNRLEWLTAPSKTTEVISDRTEMSSQRLFDLKACSSDSIHPACLTNKHWSHSTEAWDEGGLEGGSGLKSQLCFLKAVQVMPMIWVLFTWKMENVVPSFQSCCKDEITWANACEYYCIWHIEEIQ